MDNTPDFIEHIKTGYTFKGDSLLLGGGMLNKQPIPNTLVQIPLKTLNRHGLISGATGTGKTKSLQNVAEKLSAAGVPVLLMDIKGDLSGLSQAGKGHPAIDKRHQQIGTAWTANSFPVELLTLSEQDGIRMRATISEFGPVLLSKVLGLNEVQSGIISVVFRYCDENRLPLVDLADLRKVLQWVSGGGRSEVEENYGRISPSSVGAIMRALIRIEEQGADLFFGELSFDVDDLLRLDDQGRGYINILRLDDIQNKPDLFSTFMLSLLAEIYQSFPEQGDSDRPELVLFIDEAHLIFREANKILLQQIDTMVKLIRSKGVGLIFVTQDPSDIPSNVLSQLGLKVQHALRAFTAKDRKAIRLAAENYPMTEYYDVDTLLTEMGIGEALVTCLNEKGIPTPLVHTLLTAPQSRMDIIFEQEKSVLLRSSSLYEKYKDSIDRESAYEMLAEKMEIAAEEEEKSKGQPSAKKNKEKPLIDNVTKRMILREVTRGILGVLGISGTRRRRRTSTRRSNQPLITDIMKKILSSFTLLAVALSLSFLTGCTDDDAPVTTYSIIELNTNFGTMYLHLYDETPLHRDNFSNLVETSFLDSTEFHRVIPDFVIQGGDPLSKDEDRTNDGTGGPGYTVDAEIDSSKFKHIFGALGAARKGDATNPERKSSGSQFYIVTNPDGTHFLDGNYTVFGEVLKGMDVATTIQSQQRNGSDQPLERIKMWSKKLELTADEMDEMGLADPKQ